MLANDGGCSLVSLIKLVACSGSHNLLHWALMSVYLRPRVYKNIKLEISWVGLPFTTLRKLRSIHFERRTFLFSDFFTFLHSLGQNPTFMAIEVEVVSTKRTDEHIFIPAKRIEVKMLE